eukprot:IDg13896t1
MGDSCALPFSSNSVDSIQKSGLRNHSENDKSHRVATARYQDAAHSLWRRAPFHAHLADNNQIIRECNFDRHPQRSLPITFG